MFGFDDNIITNNRISSEMAIKRHLVGFFVAIKEQQNVQEKSYSGIDTQRRYRGRLRKCAFEEWIQYPDL